MNFAVLEPPIKVFSVKFGCAVPTYDRFWHSTKVFSVKWSLLPIHESFLPRKFPAIYTVNTVCIMGTLNIVQTCIKDVFTTCTDVVALTGCARSSLGICASSSGAVAGCLLWKVRCYPLVNFMTIHNIQQLLFTNRKQKVNLLIVQTHQEGKG